MSDNAKQEQITCTRCGNTHPRRHMTGIGFSGRTTWLCQKCVLGGGADDVFSGIGKSVRRVVDVETRRKGQA